MTDFVEHREKLIRGHAPRELGVARQTLHQAAQLIADATRANLAAEPDFSHMSLTWEEASAGSGRLVSEPLPEERRIALRFAPPGLTWIHEPESEFVFPLETSAVDEARGWLAVWLQNVGLQPPAPVEPDLIDAFNAEPLSAFAALDGWFDLAAAALGDVAAQLEEETVAPPVVRCWPHHFDIAAYVALEKGDPRTARGVGIGMSPGDESFDQPYFYVTPWPAPDASALPEAPSPGVWRTEDFTGIVATAEDVLTAGLTDGQTLAAYLNDAFSAARKALGKIH